MTKFLRDHFAKLVSFAESPRASAPAMGVTLSSTGQSTVEISEVMKTERFQDDLRAIEAITLDLVGSHTK